MIAPQARSSLLGGVLSPMRVTRSIGEGGRGAAAAAPSTGKYKVNTPLRGRLGFAPARSLRPPAARVPTPCRELRHAVVVRSIAGAGGLRGRPRSDSHTV